MYRWKAYAATALAAVAASGALAAPALAQNSTVDSTMSGTYYIEARIWKDAGNGDPTHFATSAWTYHGAALQKMTWIKNVATIQVWGGSGMSGSCTLGGSDTGANGSCTSNWSTTSSTETLTWENGNAYESETSGLVHPTFGTYWMKVCSNASAYSAPLGIHGNTTACVG